MCVCSWYTLKEHEVSSIQDSIPNLVCPNPVPVEPWSAQEGRGDGGGRTSWIPTRCSRLCSDQ